MALVGIVVRTDSKGNYIIRPEKGGNFVVLQGSYKRQDINFGDRIGCGDIQPEKREDSTDDYEKIPWKADVLPSKITEALRKTYVPVEYALVAYDRLEHGPNHLIVIAKKRNEVHEAIGRIEEMGFAEGFAKGQHRYWSEDCRHYGRGYTVPGNFAEVDQGKAREKGLLPLPLEGLVHEGSIEGPIFRVFVEGALLG